MNPFGILLGLAMLLIVAAGHVLVIKGEYYFGSRIAALFLLAGLVILVLSLWAQNDFLSAILGLLGFTFLWSIHELKQQEKRVQKGWFPKNPRRSE